MGTISRVAGSPTNLLATIGRISDCPSVLTELGGSRVKIDRGCGGTGPEKRVKNDTIYPVVLSVAYLLSATNANGDGAIESPAGFRFTKDAAVPDQNSACLVKVSTVP